MKRVVIAIGIMLATMGLCLFMLLRLERCHSELVPLLDSAITAIDAGDLSELSRHAQEIERVWETHAKKLELLLHSEQLDQISSAATRLEPLVGQGALAEYSAQLHHIKSMFLKLYDRERSILRLFY